MIINQWLSAFPQTVDEYSEQMHDLSRKFFHELLRHHRFTKAFRLAVDLNDYDLFMDIHHAANRLRRKRQNVADVDSNVIDETGDDGLADLAQAALIKVKPYPRILASLMNSPGI